MCEKFWTLPLQCLGQPFDHVASSGGVAPEIRQSISGDSFLQPINRRVPVGIAPVNALRIPLFSPVLRRKPYVKRWPLLVDIIISTG